MASVSVRYLDDYVYTHSLVAGTHAYYADQPENMDGDDLGPDPYALLLWALGACTSMTLMRYARRQGWDLRDVHVHLHHERVHATDCEHCDDPNARLERIERVIELEGDLTAEQRRRLLAVAARCPVHRTLQTRPVVVDRLADSLDEPQIHGATPAGD
ncbi:MAG: OsmC family protein [Dehalococcoidia bacterium]